MRKGEISKIWLTAKKITKNLIKKFPKINPVILQLLSNRKISDVENFLKADYLGGQHDPFLLSGLKKAKERILFAKKNKEKVAVFGHFDCDGICAAALLSDGLEKLKIDHEVYIPERRDGYQINEEYFKDFKKKKISLIITVDFGITDVGAGELAKNAGIDLIITDHHQPPKKLPKAYAIVSPLLSKKYPFKELSGTGVVYKLTQSLIDDERFLKWSLDLVALATIADVTPLVEENRIFTKYGLIVLKKTKRTGLLELYKKASIDQNTINTYTVGFQIAPRLNASGRMDHALSSYYLLKTKNKDEAEKIAEKLNTLNSKRQQILDKSLSEALKKVEKDNLAKNKLIILSDKSWVEGVLGLIAGKVTEIFTRPSIVLREDGDHFRGSARSIDEFHITNALREYEDILERVGGHKKAAGLTVKKNLMKDLYNKLTAFAEHELNDKDIMPKLNIDAEISLANLSRDFWDEIQKLEPHGYGNPKPVFATRNISVSNVRTMGREEKHLSLNVSDKERFIRAVGFEMGDLAKKIKPGDKIDIAYNLELNSWNGNEDLELRLVDVKR